MMPSDEAGPNTVADVARAYHFAACKHASQRRKGKAEEPYINHLTEVGQLVAEATGGTDLDLWIAAVLHDAVEDTDATLAEIANAFGAKVASLVQEVTDDKSLPKAERKRRQIVHAAQASPAAKIIKLADKTANLRALASSPPADWPLERRRDYILWARQVVAGCWNTSPALERAFDEAANAAWSHL